MNVSRIAIALLALLCGVTGLAQTSESTNRAEALKGLSAPEQARHGAVPRRRLQALARRLRSGDEAQPQSLWCAVGLRPDLLPARAVREGDQLLEARAEGESQPGRGRQHRDRREDAGRAAAEHG